MISNFFFGFFESLKGMFTENSRLAKFFAPTFFTGFSLGLFAAFLISLAAFFAFVTAAEVAGFEFIVVKPSVSSGAAVLPDAASLPAARTYSAGAHGSTICQGGPSAPVPSA